MRLLAHAAAASLMADGKPLRVLIVSEHASARFGGEAALPLHYFRVLRNRGIDVRLVTHSRTRDELTALYGDDARIEYVEDNWLHKLLWQLGRGLPARLAYFTTGFLSRLAAQVEQRGIVRRLVSSQAVNLIHQPIPVSPREPSLMFGFGVPVVIGPMNGGMDYPAEFRRHRRGLEHLMLAFGRWSSVALNALLPGKREAALLLVANQRTRSALPQGFSRQVVELVENGVDLTVWRHNDVTPVNRDGSPVVFMFLGRLVDWKAVDILIEAFSLARPHLEIQLKIVGDGPERKRLESLAAAKCGGTEDADSGVTAIGFTGWLSQKACALQLQAADVLVLPSLLECGGAVVLEAMALGKPVIATAWGGPLDYLDEHCGILVPPENRQKLIDGLAAAITRLALDPDEREAMGARGRDKVANEYDWEVKIDAMLDLYRRAQEHGRFG